MTRDRLAAAALGSVTVLLAACQPGSYTVDVSGGPSTYEVRVDGPVSGSGTFVVDPTATPTPSPTTAPPTTTVAPPPPTTTLPPPTTTTPPPPPADTAAARFGWGTPVPAGSDEFNYTGAPDATRWHQAGECWDGHAGNGRRCASRSTVAGGFLRQTGLANGDTGWLASKFGQRYGRWEVRARSANVAATGSLYHPVLITWPDSNRWPDDGEYDFLENGAPGQQCAEAWLHYPHPPGPTQQEHAVRCGVDLTQWHSFALEWTPTHLAGFIDGVEWFRYSGGAGPGGRACIQCAPSMHQTIQLDGFHGDGGYRAATFDVDWARVYRLP